MPEYKINAYLSTAQEAQSIATRLDAATTRLMNAIEANGMAQTKLREAKDALSSAEAQAIFHENMRPENVFKGIATTSKMYGYAIDAFLADKKEPGDKLSIEAEEVKKAFRHADLAATELAQAQALFTALKHIADLKGHILAAE